MTFASKSPRRPPSESVCLFGIRQSGVLDFKIADVFQDAALLQEANAAAERLLLEDPDLSQEQHRKLKDHLQKKLKDLMLETTL